MSEAHDKKFWTMSDEVGANVTDAKALNIATDFPSYLITVYRFYFTILTWFPSPYVFKAVKTTIYLS